MNKSKYMEFYQNHPDIPIFSAPWWLDTVCGENNWDVILIETNNKIIASFPYFVKTHKFGLKSIKMPVLTQKLGPYIVPNCDIKTEYKRIEYENGIYKKIIDLLPSYDNFSVNFDYKYRNWLQFYWNGFKQTTYYTYLVKGFKGKENIIDGFVYNKKQKIRKEMDKIRICYDLPKEAFYNYFEEAIIERGEVVSFSRELFYKLYDILYKQSAGRVFYCIDDSNNILALNFTIWDSTAAYYLIAMRKKGYNNTGATEILIYETMKYVSQFVDIFDFEGSMIPEVERIYRSYGTQQTEYYIIQKTKNKLYRLYKTLREK